MHRFWVGFIAGVVAGVVATFALAVAVVGRSGPLLQVRFAAPDTVEVGKPFDLRLKVRNVGRQAGQLHSIDIDQAFLNDVQVQAIVPQPTDSMNVPVLNQRSWFFEHPLSPEDSIEIVFSLFAATPGRRFGKVDVCNSEQDCTTMTPVLEVLPRRSGRR